MSMTDYCVVVTTVAGEAKARALASAVLASRTAACVQWFAVESMYLWKGAVENEREILVQAKTTRDRCAALQECIRNHHDYETPEIIVLPITDGLPEYLDWIRGQTRP